jgi:hypothetical protein
MEGRALRRGGSLGALAVAAALALAALRGEARQESTTLRFEVSVAKGLLAGPTDGRVLVVLGRRKNPEPRHAIGRLGLDAPPVLGRDANGLAPGRGVTLDGGCLFFPLARLADLPRGDYVAQAVFDHNRDLKRPDAPGNLYSDPLEVTLDPARGGAVRLELRHRVPLEDVPAGDESVKFVKLRSELLSKFHGRPIYLRAGVLLPPGHARDRERRYPLRVHVGGYGQRFTAVRSRTHPLARSREAWSAEAAPRFLLLHLDGAGPFGDPYQVNSANNGPYGDAVTRELIPHVEKAFRGVGRPYARVLDGASTGGWVSVALQVFYPDFFNGAWSHCPDPLDFRAFELINIYKDANAYLNARGFERPAARELNGDVRYTMRHECLLERVVGRGDQWTRSGRDWGAWNATFGPRGPDGLPRPLWDGKTGALDRAVTEHWQKYDLRLVLQKGWPVLGPKLRGKLHIWVGEADEYFLNNGVRLLDEFLKRAKPAFEGKITYGPAEGHDWRGLSERQLLDEMAAAVERGRRAAEAAERR